MKRTPRETKLLKKQLRRLARSAALTSPDRVDNTDDIQNLDAMINRRVEQHLRDLAICQGIGKISAATSEIAVETPRERTLTDVLAAVEGLSSRTAALDGQVSSLKVHMLSPVCSEAVTMPDDATSLASVPALLTPEEKSIPKIPVESEGKNEQQTDRANARMVSSEKMAETPEQLETLEKMAETPEQLETLEKMAETPEQPEKPEKPTKPPEQAEKLEQSKELERSIDLERPVEPEQSEEPEQLAKDTVETKILQDGKPEATWHDSEATWPDRTATESADTPVSAPSCATEPTEKVVSCHGDWQEGGLAVSPHPRHQAPPFKQKGHLTSVPEQQEPKKRGRPYAIASLRLFMALAVLLFLVRLVLLGHLARKGLLKMRSTLELQTEQDQNHRNRTWVPPEDFQSGTTENTSDNMKYTSTKCRVGSVTLQQSSVRDYANLLVMRLDIAQEIARRNLHRSALRLKAWSDRRPNLQELTESQTFNVKIRVECDTWKLQSRIKSRMKINGHSNSLNTEKWIKKVT